MARTITFVLALLLSKGLNIHAVVLQHGHAVRFREYDNMEFETHLLLSLRNVRSALKCVCICGQFNNCASVFYNKPNKMCRLHDTVVFNNANGLSSAAWTFYRYGENYCPSHRGFIRDHEGLCIHATLNTSFTYQAGQQYCQGLGSRLLTLETAEKRQAFQNLMTTLMENDDLYPLIYRKQFYIGLQKDHHGNSWYWNNDGMIEEEDLIWDLSQPYCPSAPCECATTFQAWDWRWNDISCTESHRVICEYIWQ